MKNEPFVIERTFNAPVDRVWKAITNKDEMKQWYFDIPDFKLEVGHTFEFTAGAEGKMYTHLCKVTEIVTNKKLAYTWRYPGEPGDSLVTMELFPEGDSTKFRLTHTGLETFPQNEDFRKENFAAGWTDLIGKFLKEFVEN